MNKSLAILLSLGVSLPAMAGEAPKVFAHYMTCFSATPDFYRREIDLAKRYGIDGFALNCGEWKKLNAKGEIEDTPYVRSADGLYEAAKSTGPDFKLFFSPDFAGRMIRLLTDVNLGDMVTRYREHPNQFYYNGKQFLSGYSGRLVQYAGARQKLAAEGLDLTLVPAASLPQSPMAWTFERVLDLLPPDGPLDGLFRFTCDGTIEELIDANAIGRRATLYRDKLYMAGVCPAYNSPNLRDFQGMRGYLAMWEGLIRDGADFVEIVTWNDYNEDSNLMPYRWRPGGKSQPTDKRYYDRDESFLDVTAFCSAWYKSGTRPEITQDKIYFGYRSRGRDLTKIWNEKENKWDDIRFTGHPQDQIHDDVQDQVYVTTFLTEPADLQIIQGDKVETVSLPAGISHASATMNPGFTPQFRLTRNNKDIINVAGRKEIVNEPTPLNSTQAYHLANRLWMSGAVAGKPSLSFPLRDKTLSPGAEPLVIDVKGAGNRVYNFRLTYRNSSSTETRLTLYANGAPGAEGDFPYYFPLTLPPTGDEFRTISFFWSTWEGTTKFTIRSDASQDPALKDADFNDYGEATLQKLELIPVEVAGKSSAPASAHPELVAIPGGEFLMGSKEGKPDESPVRKVKISPFAMGKYEVTNEEFERFMPEHRKMRDGYSWRDGEPVIYVSWTMAAKYCNFLSRENGLTPAYDESTWKLIDGANGFRLPTEAEWEYVASGRGEDRLFPWGNDAPTSEHGNFELGSSPSSDPRRTSSIARGVQVVGDFPLGASRDGVMDLAGNVAEWCTDTYRDYQPGDTANPISQAESPYRAIRGGSWGYYNHSQRTRDREFNNANYGGYIYLGFRVALPQSGLEKLSH